MVTSQSGTKHKKIMLDVSFMDIQTKLSHELYRAFIWAWPTSQIFSKYNALTPFSMYSKYHTAKAGAPARTEGRGARFLLRAHYKHFCSKIIKSLERAGGAAAPPAPQRRRPCAKGIYCIGQSAPKPGFPIVVSVGDTSSHCISDASGTLTIYRNAVCVMSPTP